MLRRPIPPHPDEDKLIAAWEAALGARGLRLAWTKTGDSGASWPVDAVAANGDQVGNGMGDTGGEALEVLVWNVFGHDPTASKD